MKYFKYAENNLIDIHVSSIVLKIAIFLLYLFQISPSFSKYMYNRYN